MKKGMLVSMILLCSIFLWGCSNGIDSAKKSLGFNSEREEKHTINLYFTNADNSKILSETREVTVKKGEDIAKVAIMELLKGPNSPEMKKAIPENTKLLDIQHEGTMVIVNFSNEYNNTGSVGEIVARFSVVNTLCDLEDIQKVKILVEGIELVGPSGKPFGALSKEDVVIETTQNNNITVKLYFADKNGEYLVPETRQIVVKDKEPLEKYIVQELIKGPKDKNLQKTIPSETKLISIETNEGVCVISFSQDFQLKHWGGSAGELMTIYSIVNSLTELPNIRKVQFLIEGQKSEVFKEHIIFNEPFERNESLIKKK